MKLKELASKTKAAITRMANSGLSVGSIAKRLGLSNQLVNAYILKRQPEKYMKRKKEEESDRIVRKAERNWKSESGRKGKFIRELRDKYTDTRVRKMNRTELDRLFKKMQKIILKDVKEIEDAKVPSAAVSFLKKVRMDGFSYLERIETFYEAMTDKEMKELILQMKTYIMDKRSGYLEGAVQVGKEEIDRATRYFPSDAKRAMEYLSPRLKSKFWSKYRTLLEELKGLHTFTEDGYKHVYGSDYVVQMLYDQMVEGGMKNFKTEQDAWDYMVSFLGIMNDKLYEAKAKEEKNDRIVYEKQKRYAQLYTTASSSKANMMSYEDIYEMEVLESEGEVLPF